MTARQRPESGIQASIIEALGLAPDFTLYRNNVGIAKHEDGSRVRYGLMVGSSDLVGILAPHGRWVCLEVKAPGKYATAEQKHWQEHMRKRGAFAAVVRSAAEAVAALDRARAGGSE